MAEDEIIYKDECYAIIGACFELHNELGSGFAEPIYQEALEVELKLQGIPFRSQDELEVHYKGHLLDAKYKPDFICYEKIIVEIKSLNDIADRHRSQVHNYLKITGFRLGILVNFSAYPRLQYERIVH